MRKNVIFDQDGTLLDSGRGIKLAAKDTLRSLSLPIPSDLDFFIGPPLRDSLLFCGVKESEVDEAIRLYRQFYEKEGKYGATVYPFIPFVLQKLKEDGYRLFVCTSKVSYVSKDILKHFSLASYFEGIFGSLPGKEKFTKGEIIARCLREHPAEASLMVGDTYLDIEGAKKNHILSVYVTYGYGKREQALAFSPDALADGENLLEKIRNSFLLYL